MAKKNKNNDAAADAAPDAPEPMPTTDFGSPEAKQHPVAIWQEDGSHVMHLHDAPRALEVVIGGVPYEHVETRADGVWVYRNQRKN